MNLQTKTLRKYMQPKLYPNKHWEDKDTEPNLSLRSKYIDH